MRTTNAAAQRNTPARRLAPPADLAERRPTTTHIVAVADPEAPHVLVVEGQGLLPRSLALAIAAEGVHVTLAQAETPAALLETAAAAAADVLLLDLDTCELGSIAALVPALAEHGTAVVLLMSPSSRLQAAECVAAGAAGAIGKECSLDELLRALHEVRRSGALRLHGQREELLPVLREESVAAGALAPFARLTPAERAILAGLMEGKATSELATERCVTVETVRTQIKALLRKMGVRSKLAAVAMARSAGWFPGHSSDRPAVR